MAFEVVMRLADDLCPDCRDAMRRADETWTGFDPCSQCAAKFAALQQASREALESFAVDLQRDAAISLLLEAPAECSTDRPGWASPNTRCGNCWPCRVDKFLRDAGVRR